MQMQAMPHLRWTNCMVYFKWVQLQVLKVIPILSIYIISNHLHPHIKVKVPVCPDFHFGTEQRAV